MAHNRGRTRPERKLARALWHSGFRYLTDEGYRARYARSLPGHPDVIFTRKRIIIFLDGCFWHGCPTCRRLPTDAPVFWREKVRRNAERDRRVTAELEQAGWTVYRVWEHEVRTKEALEGTVRRLVELLTKGEPSRSGSSEEREPACLQSRASTS